MSFKLEIADQKEVDPSEENNNKPPNIYQKTIKRRKRIRRRDYPIEALSNLESQSSKFATSSDIIINGEPKRCLMDSGAQTSFVNFNYIKQLKIRPDKIEKKRKWVTANGSPLEVAGQTVLNLQIGRKIIKSKFVIAKDINYDVIIGVDILKPNKFIIDY
ncbi:MAG: retroviral-like aspartic protease, partial [Bacteroidetes bacterium]|nr:retroviral-like aspartic protease [Bacteroidota bacterium]